MRVKKTDSTLIEYDTFKVIGIRDMTNNELSVWYKHKGYGDLKFIVGFESKVTPDEELLRMIHSGYIFNFIINDCEGEIKTINTIINRCDDYPYDDNPIGEKLEYLEATINEIRNIDIQR